MRLETEDRRGETGDMTQETGGGGRRAEGGGGAKAAAEICLEPEKSKMTGSGNPGPRYRSLSIGSKQVSKSTVVL